MDDYQPKKKKKTSEYSVQLHSASLLNPLSFSGLRTRMQAEALDNNGCRFCCRAAENDGDRKWGNPF